jgi:hypothetical protein
MARLREVKSWMRWWGWDLAAGVKRDLAGQIVARMGDPAWMADTALTAAGGA